MTGVSLKALRVYEACGLVERPVGSRGGYDESMLDRLRLVLALRDLGWSTERIQRLLQQRNRNSIAQLLTRAVEDGTERIERCKRARAELVAARDRLFECSKCEKPEEACQVCAKDGVLDACTRTLLVRNGANGHAV